MLICRTERPGDGDEIDELVCAAFGREQEGDLVWALREQGAISMSQVAEYEDAIIGHLLMSPILIEGEDTGWLALAPISVWPECQRQGIASALIIAALDCANELDWAGVVLLGDPEFYGRFGFKPAQDLGLSLKSEAASTGEILLAMAFKPPVAKGRVTYHPAFG
ncbi:GNAT family N-acetyltransferase [Oceanisphaera profunda]|uniref:GNAT family N-acetyltransferase n=1 Tax=Oceanisphaera profunda TaxID=1416627 RepID=A0A1Y0D3C3_9GAMM|nr:N-acetyltransferase [Oceanisphaera profunda]ART81824.1 GNAT family N-acetyltransferase [Oceanisphaera profunda]